MKHCNICKVDVRGNRELCPLCQKPLVGEGEENLFPEIPTVYHKYPLFFRILILASIAAAVVSLLVNYLLPQSGRWSLFVLLGIACLWICLVIGFRGRKNIARGIAHQAIIIAIFGIVWDLVVGWRGWSLDFMIPIDCVVSLTAIIIVAKLTKLPVEEYILFLLLAIVFGLIPLVLLLLGLIQVVLPSLLCVAFCIVFLAALWLFEGKSMVAEIQRRLHV